MTSPRPGRPLRVAVLSDSVAGLDPAEAGTAIARGWSGAGQVAVIPMASGGIALAQALAHLLRGTVLTDGDRWAVHAPATLAVGVAQPTGGPWAPRGSTAGLGDWLAACLDAATETPGTVIADLTGVTAHDAGAGLLAGLGALADGDLRGGLAELGVVTRVDLSPARRRLGEVQLMAVAEPGEDAALLLGLRGTLAERAFAAGLDPAELIAADAQVSRWSTVLPGDPGQRPGSGVGGGAGLAVLSLGGRLVDGPTLCAEMAGLEATLAAADLVVTACDSFDIGSRGGAVVRRVAEWAERAQRPCLVFARTCSVSRREMRTFGVEAAYQVGLEMGAEPGPALTAAARRIATGWLSGAASARLD